jgi:DNA-binding MarR family transcriptional regulator
VPPDPSLDRLVSAAGAAVDGLRRRIVAAHDLSTTAFDLLRALDHEAAPRTQRDLAARLRIAPASLTPHLVDLEARGLLTRVRDGGDRRIVRVRPTARGTATRRAVQAALEREWRRAVPAAGPDEPAVRRYLERLRVACEECPDRPESPV